MKNVIITGGTGFLGRNMIQRLCREGYQVWAVVRPDSPNAALLPQCDALHVLPLSLDRAETAIDLFPQDCEAFFHFAWRGVNRKEIDNDLVQRANIDLSLKAVDLASRLGCACFVFSGSRSEYGALQGRYRETAECLPLVAYGKAKLEFGRQAAAICRKHGMRYLHARIFSVYGPGDHPWSLIQTTLRHMLRDEPIDLSLCTQLWNYIDVRDMADLMLTMLQKRSEIPSEDSGIFNVASNDIRPLRDFVEEMRSITQTKSELRYGAYRQSVESAQSLVPDMEKVERILNWQSKIPFSVGIRHLIEHMEENDA